MISISAINVVNAAPSIPQNLIATKLSTIFMTAEAEVHIKYLLSLLFGISPAHNNSPVQQTLKQGKVFQMLYIHVDIVRRPLYTLCF